MIKMGLKQKGIIGEHRIIYKRMYLRKKRSIIGFSIDPPIKRFIEEDEINERGGIIKKE